MPTNYRFRDPNSSYTYDFLFDDVFVPYDLFRQGNLWTWGRNSSGVLGNNTTKDISTPVTTFVGYSTWKQVSCGYISTAGIKVDGTLWTWGGNSYGQLGDNTTISRSTPVTTFAGGTNWKQVACGKSSIFAIKTDGTLWAWGYNFDGQLGINDGNRRSTPVTTFAGGGDWKQVSSNGDNQGHWTAAVKLNGTLWTWGNNSDCRLGVPDGNPRSTPVTTFAGGNNWDSVSTGANFCAAIKTDGTLWVWGQNFNSGLAINSSTISVSTPVTTIAGGNDWKQVSCGTNHVSAIKNDGTLWVWGLNDATQSGTGSSLSKISSPLTTFAGGTNWKQVSSGDQQTLAIKTDGSLWCWGRNLFGVLGINSTTNQSTPVTTFAGGNNWKQVSVLRHSGAIQYIDYLTN